MPKNNSAARKTQRRDVITAACTRCNHQSARHNKKDGGCSVVIKVGETKCVCDCAGYLS